MKKVKLFILAMLNVSILYFVLMLSGCSIVSFNTDSAYRHTEEETQPQPVFPESEDPEKGSSESVTGTIAYPGDDKRLQDFREAKAVLEKFYKEAYDQYLKAEYTGLADVLVLSSITCVEQENKIRQAIEEHEMKGGSDAMQSGKLPFNVMVINTIEGGRGYDNEKYIQYLYELRPMIEEGAPSGGNDPSLYPSFMEFGLNACSFCESEGSWKIDGFNDLSYIQTGFERIVKELLEDYYNAAWEQYCALDCTGLQEMIDEASPAYQMAEAALMESIEIRKEAMRKDPKLRKPEKMDYAIRILEVNINLHRSDRHEYGTVRFELEPMEKRDEGMTEEEYLSQYPLFMTFGENNYTLTVHDEGAVIPNTVNQVVSWKIAGMKSAKTGE